MAIGAVVAVLVGIALVTGFLSPPGGPAGSGPPPATSQVVARIEAASVAFDASGGWVADDHNGTVRHFDPSSGQVLGRPVPAGIRPISVTAGYGRIWVADISGSQVFAIDPAKQKVAGSPIPMPQGPVSIAAGDGGVWVASLLSGTVSLINPRTHEVTASAALPDGAVRLVVGPDGVWVTGQTDTVTLIKPKPQGVSLSWRTVRVGRGPIGVAAGDGSVWVANVQSGTVSRVDPGNVRVTATFPIGAGAPANGSTSGPVGSGANAGVALGSPEVVAVWQNRLWVADGQQGVMVAIDPSNGRQIGGAVHLPGVMRDLVVDSSGALWGTTANPGSVLRFS
ncbi:MAG TPA: hypothetical protein VKU86_01140 [Acidimicrobiales bacterium]|nr:hypothetical protein [Acidimicrobiales bacterium]